MDRDGLLGVTGFDPQALRELMQTYGQDVWNYAFALTRQHHLADDVAQDVFIRAARGIGSFRSESSVRTWLLAITRNVTVNYRRSAFMRRVLLLERPGLRQTAPSAEAQAMDREAVDDLWNIVLALPPKYREVLVLEATHRLSVREIAELLHISEGTVKSRLHRARRKVEDALKEANGYEPA